MKMRMINTDDNTETVVLEHTIDVSKDDYPFEGTTDCGGPPPGGEDGDMPMSPVVKIKKPIDIPLPFGTEGVKFMLNITMEDRDMHLQVTEFGLGLLPAAGVSLAEMQTVMQFTLYQRQRALELGIKSSYLDVNDADGETYKCSLDTGSYPTTEYTLATWEPYCVANGKDGAWCAEQFHAAKNRPNSKSCDATHHCST